MSLEHRSDPASFANPVATQADFTCSMTLNVIKIQDTGKGAKSVAEDLEAVLRKIEYWHQGSVATGRRYLKEPLSTRERRPWPACPCAVPGKPAAESGRLARACCEMGFRCAGAAPKG